MDRLLAQALGDDATQLAVTEKRELLARLFARLAHEIRNPLSSLQIHLQLLEEELSDRTPKEVWQASAERWEFVHTELRRLENIVTQFLQLAAPSALEIENVDLAATGHYVAALLRPDAAQRGVEMELDFDPALTPIAADSDRLKQVLLNLMINALQAVPQGGRIGLQIRPSHEPPGALIRVWDTGPGVPADKASTIFDPFFTTKTGGSGLGLWIVQQIITAHGGSIRVGDRPGGGALFTLLLPDRGARSSLSHG